MFGSCVAAVGAARPAPPDELRPALVHLQVLHPGASPPPGALLRAWHREGGRLLEVVAGGEGRFLASLPPGSFEFAFGHASSGWTDLGRLAPVAGESHDLGLLSLPPPGRLRLAGTAGVADVAGVGPDPPALQLDLLRRAGPLDARVLRGPLSRPLDVDLPPGDYELRLDGELHVFTIEPGGAHELGG